MIHLEKYTEAFEDEYYETVQAKIGEDRFDQLIEISKKLLPEGFYTSGKSEDETLILADYSKIRAAFNCIENKKNQGIPLISEEEKEALENYQKEFGKVMAAEKNKRKLNVRLVQASGIRICPYCNRDYINSRGKKIAGAELDHFYSRKDYPVFALSLYNLCNLTEYLTKRTFKREIRCEVTGNDGKPRKIKGFRELMRSCEMRL